MESNSRTAENLDALLTGFVDKQLEDERTFEEKLTAQLTDLEQGPVRLGSS